MARLLLIGALLEPVAAAADVAAALKSTCEGVAKKYDVSCSVALYGRSGGMKCTTRVERPTLWAAKGSAASFGSALRPHRSPRTSCAWPH